MIIRLYCQPYNIKKLVNVDREDETFMFLVKEASKVFSIPEAAVALSVNNQKIGFNELISQYCQNGSVVTVDIDLTNLEQKEQQLNEEKLNKALEQNVNVQSLFNFLVQANQKLVQQYILASQEKLQYAGKIVSFVKALENNELKDMIKENKNQAIQGKIMSGKKVENQIQKVNEQVQEEQTIDQQYPQSYLSYNQGTVDEYIEINEALKKAKIDLSSQSLPVSLTDTQLLVPTKVRESDDQTYELDQLKDKNINTVLIENLFTEVGVMYKFTSAIMSQLSQKQVTSWQEMDKIEDINELNNRSQFVLSQLIDVKDMLLNQYLIKQRTIDQEQAKGGWNSYIKRLEQFYQNEIQQVEQLMDGQEFNREEALQALEQFNGNVQKAIEFITK